MDKGYAEDVLGLITAISVLGCLVENLRGNEFYIIHILLIHASY